MTSNRLNKTYSVSQMINLAECVTIDASLEALLELIQTSRWSPSTFNKSVRNNRNFKGADLFVLDVDDGMPIDLAITLFKDYNHIIGTTRNHQKEKNGKTSDRFRVILVLDKPINSGDQYREVFAGCKGRWDFIDGACKDPARYFEPCVKIVSVVMDKTDLIVDEIAVKPPINSHKTMPAVPSDELGVLSKATLEGLSNGVNTPGSRNAVITKMAADFREQNYPQDVTLKQLLGCTNLDEYEVTKIVEWAYSKEPKYPPRIPSVAGGESEASKRLQLIAAAKNFVLMWLENNKVTVTYSEVFHMGSIMTKKTEILRKLRLVIPQGATYLDDLLEEWVAQEKQRQLESFTRNVMGFKPEAVDELAKMMEIFTGRRDELEVAVMRHFIWQIKRKMLDLPVIYHMMPMFYGKQGTGKSLTMRRLLNTLGELWTDTNLTQMTGEQAARLAENHFVLFFDEMSGSSKTEVEALKQLITGDKTKNRAFFTQSYDTMLNRATFLGAANRRLRDLIKDTSGARRFYEIEVTPKVDMTSRESLKEHWSKLKNINYGLIWHCADEREEEPYIGEFYSEIVKNQNETMRHIDPVEQFVLDCCVVGDENFTSTNELWNAFKDYLGGRQGTWSKIHFSKYLANIDSVVTKREGKPQVRGFNMKIQDPELNEEERDF